MVSVQRPDLGSVWTLCPFPPYPSGRSCPAPAAQIFIRAAGISGTGPLWPGAAWFGRASWACVRANAFPNPRCPLRSGLYVRVWVCVSVCESVWLLNLTVQIEVRERRPPLWLGCRGQLFPGASHYSFLRKYFLGSRGVSRKTDSHFVTRIINFNSQLVSLCAMRGRLLRIEPRISLHARQELYYRWC